MGSSLAKRLYDLSGTNIQVDTCDGTLGTLSEDVAVPPSGKRLIINRIMVFPESVGANGKVTIQVFDEDDTLDYSLFTSLMWNFASPVVFDFSSCPIRLKADQKIGVKAAQAAQSINMTITSFVTD